MPESLIGFILMMICVALAHRAGRKTAEARAITPTVGREARTAALLALVAGLFTGIGQYVYLAFINPALRELQHSIILERARPELAKLSEDAAFALVEKIEAATSPAARGIIYGLNTLVFTALLGIAFALVFKAAVKRDQPNAST